MKTKIVFAVRCYPKRTIAKLSEINSDATAYVTELIRNKKGEVLCSTRGFTRVFDYDELEKAAKAGYNVIYKTASLSRCSKFYVQSEAVEKLNLIKF